METIASAPSWKLSDDEWARCRQLFERSLGKTQTGRPMFGDDRHLVEMVLYHHFNQRAPRYRSTGWNYLPQSFRVSPATANRRYREWMASGAWTQFWDILAAVRAEKSSSDPSSRRQHRRSRVQDIIALLESAHSYFNQRFFLGLLSTETAITLESQGRKNLYGFFRRRSWPAGARAVDHIGITIRALRKGRTELLHTLLHEMVHQWDDHKSIDDCNQRYHNAQFRDSAHLAGLECRWTSPYGYSRTHLTERARRVIAEFKT